MILLQWSKDNKIIQGQTYSACSVIQLISNGSLAFTLLLTLLPIIPHIQCGAALFTLITNHFHHLIQPFIKYTLSNTVIWKTHSYKMYNHAHIQVEACAQWIPVYLRLLLLGCDPVSPGWSGLCRFWRTESERAQVHVHVNIFAIDTY